MVWLRSTTLGGPLARDHAEPIPPAEEVVALAADHLAFGLAGLCGEARPLALDPAELADDRQTDRIVGHRERHGHAHAAVRRVDAQMQVLDGLADDVHRRCR